MSGSTRQFKKKLLWVVPKTNLKTREDIRTICACLHDKHKDCVEIVSTEEQYRVKFHGFFREQHKK